MSLAAVRMAGETALQKYATWVPRAPTRAHRKPDFEQNTRGDLTVFLDWCLRVQLTV